MVIFGIPPPANIFNPDSRSDFALKSQIPSFNLNMEISTPEKSVWGLYFVSSNYILLDEKTLFKTGLIMS